MRRRILCRNGHPVGIVTRSGITVQHRKRKVFIKRGKCGIVLKITCDKCGDEVEVYLQKEGDGID